MVEKRHGAVCLADEAVQVAILVQIDARRRGSGAGRQAPLTLLSREYSYTSTVRRTMRKPVAARHRQEAEELGGRALSIQGQVEPQLALACPRASAAESAVTRQIDCAAGALRLRGRDSDVRTGPAHTQAAWETHALPLVRADDLLAQRSRDRAETLVVVRRTRLSEDPGGSRASFGILRGRWRDE